MPSSGLPSSCWLCSAGRRRARATRPGPPSQGKSLGPHRWLGRERHAVWCGAGGGRLWAGDRGLCSWYPCAQETTVELWPRPLSAHSGSGFPLSALARLPPGCPQAHLACASYTGTATRGAEDCDWLPAGPLRTSDTRRVLVPHPGAQPQASQRGHTSLSLTDPGLRDGDFRQTAPTEDSLLDRSHRFSPRRSCSDAQHGWIIS